MYALKFHTDLSLQHNMLPSAFRSLLASRVASLKVFLPRDIFTIGSQQISSPMMRQELWSPRRYQSFLCNSGDTYVIIDTGAGAAIRAASPFTPASANSEDKCKLTLFQDSSSLALVSY
jgi:hypothetical protein